MCQHPRLNNSIRSTRLEAVEGRVELWVCVDCVRVVLDGLVEVARKHVDFAQPRVDKIGPACERASEPPVTIDLTVLR
jgi:hypothetical protein